MNDQELQELIRDVSDETARRTVAALRLSGSVNYFKATETLLWNYKKLQKLVRDPEAYLDVTVTHRSKSIVTMAGRGSGPSQIETDDDILEALQAERLESYKRTCARFDELDMVVRLFRQEPGWPVIGMYYMGEDAEGRDRDEHAPRWTWESIALELMITEKTARRRRSKIVRNMSIVLFGAPAAVSAGIAFERAMMSGNVPDSDLDATETEG